MNPTNYWANISIVIALGENAAAETVSFDCFDSEMIIPSSVQVRTMPFHSAVTTKPAELKPATPIAVGHSILPICSSVAASYRSTCPGADFCQVVSVAIAMIVPSGENRTQRTGARLSIFRVGFLVAGSIRKTKPVSYTHLTLPTNREV